MKMMQVKCLGYYDENDMECQKHCSHGKECRALRTQDLINTYMNLLTQTKTSAVTDPIFNHFQQVLQEVEPETRKAVEQAISTACLKWDEIPTWNPYTIPIIFPSDS